MAKKTEKSKRKSRKLTKTETELLIELVRQRSYIYNVADTRHRDAQLNRNAWEAIEEGMKLDKVKDGIDLKEKWRNLKDTYFRKKRLQKGASGDGAKPKEKWVYYELLTFLNAFKNLDDDETETNVAEPDGNVETGDDDSVATTESDDGDINADEDFEGSTARSVSSEDDKEETVRSVTPPPPPAPRVQPSKAPQQVKPKRTNLKRTTPRRDDSTIGDEMIVEFLNESKRERREMRAEAKKGVNELFFESCALRTNQLPIATQGYVQMQISQVLYNAENPQMTSFSEDLYRSSSPASSGLTSTSEVVGSAIGTLY